MDYCVLFFIILIQNFYLENYLIFFYSNKWMSEIQINCHFPLLINYSLQMAEKYFKKPCLHNVEYRL